MNGLSEDDSSDSSSEYLVDPEKINLSSSFFLEKSTKVNASSKSDSNDNSTDDEDPEDVNQEINIDVFTQVLKNLENSQQLQIDDQNVNADPIVSESSHFTKDKGKEQKIDSEAKLTSSVEIDELLLQGETNSTLSLKQVSPSTTVKNESVTNESDTEAPAIYTIPKEGVKITLPGTSVILKKKNKRGQDLKALIKRRLRASQILVEKVGLLCWLAYGFNLNHQINQSEVMIEILSLISTCNYPKDRIDLTYVEKFTRWFKHLFTFEDITNNSNKVINKVTLLKVLKEKKVSDYRELVLLYIAALRAIGINCRLVISLCPPHRAFSDDPIFKSDSKCQESTKKGRVENKKLSKKKVDVSDKVVIVKNSPEEKKKANIEAKKRAAEILHSQLQKNAKKNKSNNEKDLGSKNDESNQCSVKNTDDSKIVTLKQLRSRKITANGTEINVTKSQNLSSVTDGTRSKYYRHEESSDSETEFQPKSKRVTKRTFDRSIEKPQNSNSIKKINKKVSSDSENEEINKTKKAQDIWAEIYLESEESWICASIMEEKIHCITEVYKKATKPVLYVVVWNSVGTIKDVTRRYCPHWLTVTRKQRVDDKWWQETLSYWKEKDTIMSKAEDEMLLQKELEQPLPKTIGECKGHPLYVIARHLLKFEALYPRDCVPLGHLSSGDAIYSRHCVHTLCSRETWLKKAKVVKPNQEPYKIVKSRPKYDKLSGMKIKDSPLEVFGEWQTMDYEPPEAKNGIVPRNEYGNVDLFKQCMLPKGTVHINLPALNRIARKLNIDCAPAVVGFNFGSMGAVPAMEGYVVCSEFEDTLREAWEAEQAEIEKRAREKQEKRVYGNWKKLIHGLIIRERLVAKYEFSEEIKTVANKRTKQKKTDVKKAKVS